MILITNIRACEADKDTGIITNKTLAQWNNLTRKVPDVKALKRFSHWLKWYLNHNFKVKVVILFTYKEIENENDKKTLTLKRF